MTRPGALMLTIILAVLAAAPAGAQISQPVERAQEAAVNSAAEMEATREALREVYARPEFGQEEVDLVWRPRRQIREESGTPVGEPTAGWVGPFLAWSLGILGGLILLYLVLALWRQRVELADDDVEARAPPDTLFGLDLRRSSLPKDIAAAAEEAWRRGDHREALSLLYRGALSLLTQQRQAKVPASATEGECVVLVRRQVEAPLAEDFAHLTQQWLVTAYGRQPPADEIFHDTAERWRHRLEGAW